MLNSIEDAAEVKRVAREWSSIVDGLRAVTREEIVAAVREIYLCLHKQAPIVILCQSPWQLIMMKTLIQRGVDASLRAYFERPTTDPFMPHSARWLWRDLLRSYDEQTTSAQRNKLLLAEKSGARDFWGSAIKTVLAEIPFVGSWGRLYPSLSDERINLAQTLDQAGEQYFKRNEKKNGFEVLKNLYAEEFPLATPNSSFSAVVNRELVEHCVGNQPAELRTQMLANLMSPVFADLYRTLIAAIDIEVSPDEQCQHEMKLQGLMSINELIYTRSLIGTFPLIQFLSDTTPGFRSTASAQKSRLMLAILRLARASPVVLPFDQVCLVCAQPVLQETDAAHRLHAETGTALSFSDGFQVYSWHGVRIVPALIESPTGITADKILREPNAEIRRIMLEKFGAARFVKECGAKKIHEDSFGELYRREIPGLEPLQIVKVRNSTPEPDGTFRDYFIRVPPGMVTAKEAVAWTFYLSADDYCPDEES